MIPKSRAPNRLCGDLSRPLRLSTLREGECLYGDFDHVSAGLGAYVCASTCMNNWCLVAIHSWGVVMSSWVLGFEAVWVHGYVAV